MSSRSCSTCSHKGYIPEVRKGLTHEFNQGEGKTNIRLSQDMQQIQPTALGGRQYFILNLYCLSRCENRDAILQTVKNSPTLFNLKHVSGDAYCLWLNAHSWERLQIPPKQGENCEQEEQKFTFKL